VPITGDENETENVKNCDQKIPQVPTGTMLSLTPPA
jgi:hypothetical protein